MIYIWSGGFVYGEIWIFYNVIVGKYFFIYFFIFENKFFLFNEKKKREDIILCGSICICSCEFIGNTYLILVEYFKLFFLLYFISNFNEVNIKISN